LCGSQDHKFDYAEGRSRAGIAVTGWRRVDIASSGAAAKRGTTSLREGSWRPEYPENGDTVIEGYLKWSDLNGARRELKGAWRESWDGRCERPVLGEKWRPTSG